MPQFGHKLLLQNRLSPVKFGLTKISWICSGGKQVRMEAIFQFLNYKNKTSNWPVGMIAKHLVYESDTIWSIFNRVSNQELEPLKPADLDENRLVRLL